MLFQGFMNYFGTDTGFLNYLLMYFPLYVLLFSVIVNVFTRKIILAPIIVVVFFGVFFSYAYSQFNAAMGNFIIPLMGYVVIAYIVGYVVNKIKRGGNENKKYQHSRTNGTL